MDFNFVFNLFFLGNRYIIIIIMLTCVAVCIMCIVR